MDQQQIIQFQVMEQEINQLNEQSQLIEQNISEMQDIGVSLDAIESAKSNEILTNIGKKIYLPVEIKDKNLIVEIGNKNFVKKSIPETKKVIEEQIAKLMDGKNQIMNRLEELQEEMRALMQNIEKDKEKIDKE